MTDEQKSDLARSQNDAAVGQVRQFKILEERLLRILDDMQSQNDLDAEDGRRLTYDPYWLNHGRASLQASFMFINRSVLQPCRVSLEDEDAAQA